MPGVLKTHRRRRRGLFCPPSCLSWGLKLLFRPSVRPLVVDGPRLSGFNRMLRPRPVWSVLHGVCRVWIDEIPASYGGGERSTPLNLHAITLGFFILRQRPIKIQSTLGGGFHPLRLFVLSSLLVQKYLHVHDWRMKEVCLWSLSTTVFPFLNILFNNFLSCFITPAPTSKFKTDLSKKNASSWILKARQEHHYFINCIFLFTLTPAAE